MSFKAETLQKKPLLPSPGIESSAFARGSQPRSNTRNDRIPQPSSSSHKNKVEVHRLVQNHAPSTSSNPPSKKDLDILFQPMFDEYFKPSPNASSPSTTPNTEAIPTLIQDFNVKDPNQENKDVEFDSDTFANTFTPPETSSVESSTRILKTYAMWCYFYAFLTKVKPKNYQEVMKESSWIESMQEEIQEFDHLKLDNQSIERDRLIGIGFVMNFVKFISFTFGDKETVSWLKRFRGCPDKEVWHVRWRPPRLVMTSILAVLRKNPFGRSRRAAWTEIRRADGVTKP
ncbi:hypothetical protein Tco_0163901 [Tanacetum coccineum]